MNFRQMTEELEERTLSPLAAKTAATRGRVRPESPCEVRTEYQRDRDRIIHSKAFRRLKHKTQVFIAPEGDHYRTRLTHTLEVAQIARTVARALRLNEDLTEAIALGHDLGHTPFGHAGEATLDGLLEGGFRHNEQSLRVVDILEDGGLNLTWEVRDGILNHSGGITPATLEGKIVHLADRIAYINHDIDDAIRAGVISNEQLPRTIIDALGATHARRINTLVTDLIRHSWQKDEIALSQPVERAMLELRAYMFQNVYIGSKAKVEEKKSSYVISYLFDYWKKNSQQFPSAELKPDWPLERNIADYIAGMTDRYIIRVFEDVFVPKPWLG
ncbi:MAG: deoxyguanosinetriphosphate triphosphohydrolase [Bacillota bacterium]